MPSLTDGAEPVSYLSHCCLHKDHWLATRPSIINARADMFQELWTMLKFMGLLMKSALLTVPMSLLHNNARKKLPHAKNTKFLTTVSQKIWKISNKKFSTTVQLSQSFQFTETSWFTRRACIKCLHETRDSQLDRLWRSSVGMSETDRPAGLLRTVGEKIGEKMVSRTFF